MPKPVGRAQRYMPGLDGLRAITVLAVIAFHLNPDWAPGGLLGVGVFFTLSGYLITDLLLGQRAATGSLELGQFWIYQPGVDPTRVYEGTDTRAFGLLIGAALAMVWPSRRLGADLARRWRILLDGVGTVGLVVIAILIWRTNEFSPSLYHGGIVLLSVATAATVAALVHPASHLGVAVGWKPLRWLGVRSYGIYLWHWPIIVLTAPSLQERPSLSLQVAQVAATIAVAAMSWRFFEEPIRRGALGRLWTQARSGKCSGEAPQDQVVRRDGVGLPSVPYLWWRWPSSRSTAPAWRG